MKKTIAMMLSTFALSSGASAFENDLGIFETAQIPADVRTEQSQSGEGVEVLLTASHSYTNTLDCSATFTLPATRSGRNFLKHVPVSNLKVFPENAWGPISIPVPVRLRSGEVLIADESQFVTLTCSGFDNSVALPIEFCERPESRVGHTETCQMLRDEYGPGSSYPVIIDGDLIGRCLCD